MKYTKDMIIPSNIINILNMHDIYFDINDIEGCEEQMYEESIIFPASLLFDIDFAIIKLIQEKYNKAPYWNENINKSDKEIKDLLFDREYENPLSILKDYSKNAMSLDKLFNSIIEKDFVKIMGIACNFKTNLFDLAIKASKQDKTNVTIYCDIINTSNTIKSNQQKSIIKKIINNDKLKISYVTEKLSSMKDYKDYSVLFFKFASDINKVINYPCEYSWSSKTILCSNYKMNLDKNLEKEVIDMNIVLRCGLKNNIGLTSVFEDKELHHH